VTRHAPALTSATSDIVHKLFAVPVVTERNWCVICHSCNERAESKSRKETIASKWNVI